ncbi:hypothetical protein SAMN05421736_102293 [Evansella caseinilytica]|uniref:Uncharacterized protein n=1 Tax=Evansella caseinilytica TaxID=1503961 RepID=A0A1H3KXW0_9BACI|nr:hypothetical protein [Evansella caseinilytica]SDY56920.1 hypothetical protein SAMN05421736_102293 [Evansella caseinilytica]
MASKKRQDNDIPAFFGMGCFTHEGSAKLHQNKSSSVNRSLDMILSPAKIWYNRHKDFSTNTAFYVSFHRINSKTGGNRTNQEKSLVFLRKSRKFKRNALGCVEYVISEKN